MNSRQPELLTAFRSGIFISDLHLFSPRSSAEKIQRQISVERNADQCIVLGGDIFDFRWSVRGGLAGTIQAARNWLDDLLASSGDAHIRFLPGNHDCHPDFLNALAELADCEPRFAWHEHHLQLGDCLFLHGDILDAGGDLAPYRCKFQHAKPQTGFSHRAYEVIVGLRLHKVVPMLRHRPVVTCQRLWNFILELPDINPQSIERVYFGHTHVPLFGTTTGGIRFYNPGAALKHMHAHVHNFDLGSETK